MSEISISDFESKDRDDNVYKLTLKEGVWELEVCLFPGIITRKIGKVVFEEKRGVSVPVFKTRRGREHIFKATKSFGLPIHVIEWLEKKNGYVALNFDGSVARLSAARIKSVGSTLWFRGPGFERQIFVPLVEWNPEWK